MQKNKYLLVIVVEFVSHSKRILTTVPIHLRTSQSSQSLFVEPVTSNDSKVGTDLSLKINNKSQTNSKNNFIKHQHSHGSKRVMRVMLILMSNIDMNKSMKRLGT